MQTWTVRRREVRSAGGLVAAQNREAAEAGAAVLAAGGNAMDAAVVTVLCLSVLEPWLSGVGGGGFMLHADGGSGEVATLDFNVVAPKALNPADYPLEDGAGGWFQWPKVKDDRNVIGYPSIAIPGTIAGLSAALERFGTLSFGDALEPAIRFAERGMAIDWFSSLCISIDARNLRTDPGATALFLPDGGPPFVPGPEDGALPMPGQAALLKRLQKNGARDFYEGETAAILAGELAAGGSRASAADFAAYQATWREPLRGSYRGHDLAVIPGLSGGPSLLAALGRLEAWAPGAAPNADSALAYARSIRETYADRLNTMGHAAAGGDCTSHVSVVDRNGSMVSLTNTILSRFGSKVVPPRSGILMNNGMMWFDPRPGTANAIAPGAKPLANMCPVLMLKDGLPVLALGAAGGRMIFPTVAQILSYVVDFGMSLEDAFQTPRLDCSTPTIKVNRTAGEDIAARVATAYPVEIVADTLYPTNFAIPSAAARDVGAGVNVAMAHHSSPWASVAAEAGDG
ncbi:gamma-glutamyltransferase [Acuticoccus sediminis]|nr:gamma-glutamyltransferase [Acuticoccus sediminis]